MRGLIHSFQTLGAVDGPGLRFVVFMQGCNLRCLYCHNPDTWDTQAGRACDAGDVFARILRYRPYFGRNGGVTVSGGEPLLQASFVTELFSLCRQAGIHTCLDTGGQPADRGTDALLSVTDLCLLDIKATCDAQYRALCGMDLATPLQFLNALDHKGIATWIRHVIVPGVNDTERNILELRALLSPFLCIQRIELLPFRTLCVEKYRQLGIPFPLEHTPPMDEQRLEALSSLCTTPR